AIPRFVRRAYPPSPKLFTIGEWLPMGIYVKLVENNIQTIYQFLRTPVAELARITGMPEKRITGVIRETVTKQEQSYRSPNVREFEFFPRDIEREFAKYHKAPTIHKALNKRWIVNTFDLIFSLLLYLNYEQLRYFLRSSFLSKNKKQLQTLLNQLQKIHSPCNNYLGSRRILKND
ncbi:MAG: hypothetical protein ACW97W_11250, partial [Candidatus Hodarchaeales archaeon]